MWLSSAKEVLAQNNTEYENFASAVKNALILSCKKETNILLYGPADCSITFLLKPVCKILPNVFLNSVSSTFGWMGVENSILIFLNDLKWKPPGSKRGNIEWQNLLNMLEELPVTLPAPMNSCSKHIELTKTMLIFVISIDKVRYWVNSEKEPQTDQHVLENNLIDARWNYFKFSHSIPVKNKVEVPECTKCWAKFILQI